MLLSSPGVLHYGGLGKPCGARGVDVEQVVGEVCHLGRGGGRAGPGQLLEHLQGKAFDQITSLQLIFDCVFAEPEER